MLTRACKRVSYRFAVAALTIVGLIGAQWAVSEAEVTPAVIQAAIYKTVRLVIPIGSSGQATTSCTGSFVTPNGVILSAAHCVRATSDDPKFGVVKGQLYNPNGWAAVYVNVPNQVNPVPTYWAQRVSDSPDADLSLLRVVSLYSQGNSRPLPADFRVPSFMAVRDSEGVQIGESIAVLGFPGVGGTSITVVQGHVTGFDADMENHKIWLKNDAPSAQGHSGGPIIDSLGRQIGVVSHSRLNRDAVETAAHDAMISRMPDSWAQYLRGGAILADAPPARPVLPTSPSPAVPARPVTPPGGGGGSGFQPGAFFRSVSEYRGGEAAAKNGFAAGVYDTIAVFARTAEGAGGIDGQATLTLFRCLDAKGDKLDQFRAWVDRTAATGSGDDPVVGVILRACGSTFRTGTFFEDVKGHRPTDTAFNGGFAAGVYDSVSLFAAAVQRSGGYNRQNAVALLACLDTKGDKLGEFRGWMDSILSRASSQDDSMVSIVVAACGR